MNDLLFNETIIVTGAVRPTGSHKVTKWCSCLNLSGTVVQGKEVSGTFSRSGNAATIGLIKICRSYCCTGGLGVSSFSLNGQQHSC